MRFSSRGRGTLDQLYTLHRVLEGLWEFAQPVHMCFVDLEKAFDHVPCGILWGVLREYGVRGPLLRAVRSLYDRSRSLVRIAGRAGGSPGLGTTGFHLCFLQMMLSCWLHQARTFSMYWSWFAAECEVAGMRISTSKSEAMVLDQKRKGWCALSGWVERSCLKWRSSSISGSCSQVRERWSVRLTGGLVQRPQLCAVMYRTIVVKKELNRKAKLSIYQSIYAPTLTYGHKLWEMTERTRSRIQAAKMSFLRRVDGRLP
ncbi:hypothetical protein L3Q82_021636 [Scortum barcoo]|uniref:Uncharacterized protein n=1 Tax=Scortum barcoo TaxID=214431 RepID=A0ACB8X876_9TELE|nr:hypothetical protein L3Q82_021636 [Scortum barcoo]